MTDVIIVGIGPAGLTAAVYAARKNMSTLLIGKEYGGQVALTKDIENYMGYQFISGPELINKFEDHVRQYPLEQKHGEVVKIGKEDGGFFVISNTGEKYLSKSLIIASGRMPRRLNAPGEREFTGLGVSYCAVCDAPFFKEKDVAVIGGGNSAIIAAVDLVKICNRVYVISRREWVADQVIVDRVKNAANLTKLIGYETKEIGGNGIVENITINSLNNAKEQRKLTVNGVFVEIGTVPNSNLAEGFLELNKEKEIIVECDCSTSVSGVFAAGDVTNIPEKQIIIAAGEGAKAALGAYRYLLH